MPTRKVKDNVPHMFGTVGLWRVQHHGVWDLAARKRNQIQVEFATILIKAAFHGDSNYRINAMYLEFENTDSPGDPVTVPSYSKYDGIEYYDDLVNSPNRDFLRVAMTSQPEMSAMPGYESYFNEGQGNRVTCFTLSQGTSGMHGKPFGVSSNSKVFGLGLIAAPRFADRTQDLLFARTYFAPDQQVAKEASGNIGASWQINFTL